MGSLPKLDELQSIVERISDLGSWAWTFETKRIWWSDQTYRILGLRPGELQPSVKTWLARVHPDDREEMSERARTERQRDGSAYEYRLVIGDEVRWVRTHTMIKKTEGRPTDLIGTIQDITQTRLQAEAAERMRVRTESLAHVGTWTWSLDGEVECGPELWTIIGRAPTEPSVELFDQIVHPDDRARLFDARRYAHDTGRVAPIEIRLRRPDGTERIVLFRGAPEGDRFVGIFQDVTDQRRLEARARWSETLSTTGRLAEGIAHDFNNLLTVVLGHARVLLSREPNDDLRAIIAAAESGAELTRRLQVFGSDSKREPKPVVVESVISDCTRMLARLMGDELDVRFVPSNRPTKVWLDSALLHRIILGVAVHARDTSTELLQISTFNEERDGVAGVCVAMEDDGSGILDEEPSPIATPFGLSAVEQVAAELGAQLEVSATPNEGTIVRLWLPRTDREVSTLPPIRREARGVTVLVVEDEPLVRRLIARVLEGAGYSVLLTTGPNDALSSEVEFDLLVTDLTMPDGGGRRVVREMRQRNPDVPVLYLTGFTPDPSALDAPVLLKPFRPHELLEAIDHVLAESR